ncbi:unnamed protein product [Ilex paraguariensis]|uniref:Transmembrane protein n=1 Tax=Ilex paraguariensis TaxID=185542 RepID=A0ABC8SMR8_9AQUA
MGCKFSKKIENTPDLSSFEATFGAAPELQSLRLKLKQRAIGVVTTLDTSGQVRSLSLDSLREVLCCLLENDKEVLNAVLEHQKEIWDNPELLDLVKDYFETNPQFDEEHTERSHGGKTSYSKTLQEFKNFKMAGDSFGDEQVNAWRKVSNVLFGVTFAAVAIFSAVVMAMAAPPAVIASASVVSGPLWSAGVGKLVDKLDQKMKSPSAANDLGLEKEEAVMEVVNELRNKIDVIMPELDALMERAANYRQEIRKDMETIYDKICQNPKSSSCCSNLNCFT